MSTIDSKIPEGPLAEKWTNYKAHQKLVNPANKRRLDIIVVGTGLAGGSAAWASTCLTSLFKTRPVAPTLSPLMVVSPLLKTIKTTVTRYIVYSTTPSKVATIVPAKPTFTVWPKYRTTS